MTKDLIIQTNNYLANIGVMYIKLHNLHWNVVGVNFKEVHEYLESLYDYFADKLDEVAEFIKMDEGYPYASIVEYVENATISEIDSTDYKSSDVLTILFEDVKTIRAQANIIRMTADKFDKFQLVNILEDHIAEYDKILWFVSSMKKS